MFKALSTKAVAIIIKPKIRRRTCAGRRALRDTPIVIPARAPTRNHIPVDADEIRKVKRFERNPDMETRVIDTSEVAMALSTETPPTIKRAGTIRNPPPTPNMPDSIPVNAPAIVSLMVHGQLKAISPNLVPAQEREDVVC
jgi:hypothetical protein